MSIVDTAENDFSNVEGKYDTNKVCTYMLKRSSTLFSCLVRSIYNRLNCAQKLTSHVKLIHYWDLFLDCSK